MVDAFGKTIKVGYIVRTFQWGDKKFEITAIEKSIVYLKCLEPNGVYTNICRFPKNVIRVKVEEIL